MWNEKYFISFPFLGKVSNHAHRFFLDRLHDYRKKCWEKNKVINHTQIFLCKTLLLPPYLAGTANSVFQQPAAFFPKQYFLPAWIFSIRKKKTNNIRSFAIKEQMTTTSISYCSCSLWCSQKETLLVLLDFLVLVWSHALAHPLTTWLNSCAHLRRDPAECP